MATWRPFTDNEKAIIREFYADEGAIGVSSRLEGRSPDTIKQWAYKNGLKVTKEYRSSVATRTNLIHKRNMSDETRKRIGDGHRKYPQFKCEICGKNISHYSHVCWDCYVDQGTAGESNNNWRGGVSSLSKIVNTDLAPIWKIPIFIRDNMTCQICGSHKNLQAHHIKRHAVIRDEIINENPHLSIDTVEGKFELAKLIVAAHKLSDGITLCKACHIAIHSKKRGELLEHPHAEGNQQPSQSNVLQFVDWKVQRVIGEERQANKPDTSAPHVTHSVMMYSELRG